MARVRDIRERRFYWIDNAFLDAYGAKIGLAAIAVYNALARRANEQAKAWPGKADISRLTGLSRYGVTKAIETLQAYGLIEVKRRYNPTDKTWSTNVYTLLPVEVGNSETQVGNSVEEGSQLSRVGVGNSVEEGSQLSRVGVGNSVEEPSQLSCPKQHPKNNTQRTTPSNNTQQQHPTTKSPLSAAALSLLTREGIDPSLLNGSGQNVAAWIMYAITQTGIRNPAGYAITQTRKGEVAGEVYREIAAVDLPLDELITAARNERYFRQGIQGGGSPPLETENLSDHALELIKTHLEGG